MSADLLREAANLMRERAEGAACVIGDAWRAGDRSTLYTLEAQGNDDVWHNAFECGPCAAWNESDDPKHEYVGGSEEVAEHIASWHPVVALAVADWLDAARERHLSSHIGSYFETQSAVAVACAYLGRDA